MRKGFTLIELLIVIAILGIIATVVIALLNPGQRMAQTRDAGRISVLLQMGKSIQSFYTTNNDYPRSDTWGEQLVATGYPKIFPRGIESQSDTSLNCTTNALPLSLPTYCYIYDDTAIQNGAIVYSKLESIRQTSKCSGSEAYFVYSTVDGRGGVLCFSAEPTPWQAGTVTYLD